MNFEDVAHDGKCDVCGKKCKVVVCSSSMGAVSFAYCHECLNAYREPYGAIIGFYSTCSMDEIRLFADKNANLLEKFYKKTKDEFKNDCAAAVKEFENYINSLDY